MFQLDPQTTVLPGLDPNHHDLLFPDLSLEDPDLESIMGDKVSPEMKVRILAEVQWSQTNNHWMVRSLDAKARSLYSSAIGLVNDRVKTLKRFGKVQQALDTRQKSVLRECGPFVRKPPNSLAGVKLSKVKSTTDAMPLANLKAKKKKRRGLRRKTNGIPSHNPPPPGQHLDSTNSGPAAQGLRGSHNVKSGPGKHPTLPKMV